MCALLSLRDDVPMAVARMETIERKALHSLCIGVPKSFISIYLMGCMLA